MGHGKTSNALTIGWAEAQSEAAALVQLTVQEADGLLLIDSRLIAARLGVLHSDWLQNVILKYQTQIEQTFGHLRFENGTVTNSVGAVNQTRYALLTEEQANFVMTLSRNTPQVIECKAGLVNATESPDPLLRSAEPADRAD